MFPGFAVLSIFGWTCREVPHALGRGGDFQCRQLYPPTVCLVTTSLLQRFTLAASPPRHCPESMSSHSRRPKRPLVEVADILPPAVSVAQMFTIPAGGRPFASPPIVQHSEPVRPHKRPRSTESTLGANRDQQANPPPKGSPPGEANDTDHKRTVKVST